MTIPRDVVHQSLAEERRRHLLRKLHKAEKKVAQVDTLVEYIAKKESDSDRESIYLDLYHVHLPFLDEKDVLDFNYHSETVRYQHHPKLDAELARLSDTETEEDSDTE